MLRFIGLGKKQFYKCKLLTHRTLKQLCFDLVELARPVVLFLIQYYVLTVETVEFGSVYEHFLLPYQQDQTQKSIHCTPISNNSAMKKSMAPKFRGDILNRWTCAMNLNHVN